MKSTREIREAKAEAEWLRFCKSDRGIEHQKWTACFSALAGQTNPKGRFMGYDGKFRYYDGENLRIISDNALDLWYNANKKLERKLK